LGDGARLSVLLSYQEPSLQVCNVTMNLPVIYGDEI
jgi:hypothetical protein